MLYVDEQPVAFLGGEAHPHTSTTSSSLIHLNTQLPAPC